MRYSRPPALVLLPDRLQSIVWSMQRGHAGWDNPLEDSETSHHPSQITTKYSQIEYWQWPHPALCLRQNPEPLQNLDRHRRLIPFPLEKSHPHFLKTR